MAYHRTRLCERRGANALKGAGGAAEVWQHKCWSQQAQMSFSLTKRAGEWQNKSPPEAEKESEKEVLCTSSLPASNRTHRVIGSHTAAKHHRVTQ